LVAVTSYNVLGNPSGTRYLHNNHRGDVIMARQGTNTVATLDYEPYGEIRTKSGSYTPRFRFSSKEYDAATGFYHFPYRYYAPQWGRWITRDPIGERGQPNLYLYVNNDPVLRVDSLGLKDCGPPPCTEAKPVPDSSPKCDAYGDETYPGTGISLKCFCKCAGNSKWAQQVRGCLACYHDKGVDVGEAHEICYKAAGYKDAPWSKLFECMIKCGGGSLLIIAM
jgi:RHS repeat-associated protein